ncbi:hypothetical protein JQC67_16945 [Aurantibacter crassamenti]|uniref:hypothetical protein n=1 Tax=Aurantibacter crassamenti TaxID=1837375 RepID=UPI00193A6ADB|nr:hypothetical protein [Aurantibacter crassamenti]MBM1107845.1 hypothetical protein [Aurantibacter crassamenti]
MKTIIQIVLWIACIFFGYMIYNSVTGPIEFKKVKQERFAKVVSKLKDIRDSQEAYKTVNKKYAKDFNALISFVDTGNYTITQQRDSSFLRYNKAFQIDMPVDTILIDTLGSVAVKDSLFRNDNRYKTMMNVPGAPNGEKFEMKAAIVDKGGFKAPVFEAKVAKKVILADQPAELLARENAQVSVEEINGSEIKVGSLTEVSNTGNWPPIYDSKINK